MLSRWDMAKSILGTMRNKCAPKWKNDLSRDFIAFNEEVIGFAVASHHAVIELHSKETVAPLYVAALDYLHTYVITLQRAIFTLIQSGWAQSTSPLQRCMFDSLLSMGIIAEKDRNFRAFRYFSAHLIQTLRNPNAPVPDKAESQRGIERSLEGMNNEEKKRAVEFKKNGKIGNFWFTPEPYKSQTDAIEEYFKNSPDISLAYRFVAGASHGGFVTSKLFLDSPDFKTINPRSNPMGAKLSCGSACRYSLEATRLCLASEGLVRPKEYERLIRKLVELRDSSGLSERYMRK